MEELKRIIQEAWNAGDNVYGDKFGAFLDRAALAILKAGWRKDVEEAEKVGD